MLLSEISENVFPLTLSNRCIKKAQIMLAYNLSKTVALFKLLLVKDSYNFTSLVLQVIATTDDFRDRDSRV